MICNNCGYHNDPDAIQCAKCGEYLSEIVLTKKQNKKPVLAIAAVILAVLVAIALIMWKIPEVEVRPQEETLDESQLEYQPAPDFGFEAGYASDPQPEPDPQPAPDPQPVPDPQPQPLPQQQGNWQDNIPVKPAVSKGSTVMYGSYEQDDNDTNGQEAVEWIVLEVESDRALLLSRHALDSQRYHAANVYVDWEDCSMRAWLNGEFLYSAFTTQERNGIMLTDVDNSRDQGNPEWETQGCANTRDSIFLLSYSEVRQYLGGDLFRICCPTAYAQAMGADIRVQEGDAPITAGWWWLRSPGKESNHAAFVNFAGEIYSNMVNNGYLSVRPAMWVSLDSL